MFKQVLKIGLGLSLVASSLLATPEKTKLKIGFIALTDCAPLVIAKEKGFFAAEGLKVDIEKEGGGWPGIQQKTISGEYDFAHALAGLPIAATLGINGDANLQALLSLDYNGNAITLFSEFKKNRFVSPQDISSILFSAVKCKPIKVAVPPLFFFAFSNEALAGLELNSKFAFLYSTTWFVKEPISSLILNVGFVTNPFVIISAQISELKLWVVPSAKANVLVSGFIAYLSCMYLNS